MNRVVFWKELREQAAILIALVALGAGVIASGAALGTLSSGHDPLDIRGYGEPARLATVVLTAVAGLVVGGTLFAGEYENGTAGFLLHLPTARRRLWVAKILSGLALTTAMTAALGGVALTAGVFSGSPNAAWMIWLLEIGIASFAAGAFGSAGTKQVLPACGVGIALGPFVVAFGTTFVLFAASESTNEYGSRYGPRIVTATAFAAGPIFAAILLVILSYALFTYPDVVRKRVVIGTSSVKEAVKTIRSIPSPASRFGVRALLWFMRRTWFWPGIVLYGMAFAFSIVLLIPDVPPAFVWPAMTVILGVLAGCFAFMPEQLHGVQPFWAERALPPGRLWAAKVLTGSFVLISCCVLLVVPMLFATLIRGNPGGGVANFVANLFRTALIGDGFPYFKAFFLWPAYGFAAGVLSGMLFEKPLVSVSVGLMTGAATSALWIPSLLSGGLMGWQVWPIPLVVLLLSRWLVRDWTIQRIGRGFGLKKLTGGLTLAGLMLAGTIGFRAIEVPLVPEVNDDIAFADTLPTNDEKQPGRDLKRALGQFAIPFDPQRTTSALRFFGPPTERRQWSQNQGTHGNRIEGQVYYTTTAGYPPDRPDMDDWLDSLFRNNEWTAELAKMRGRPPGVFIDPNEISVFPRLKEVEQFRNLTNVMLARALQEQARGRPAVAVEYFDSLLASIRTAKHHTIAIGFLTAIHNEQHVYDGIERWLERLDREPVHLRKLLAILQAHEAVPPDLVWEHEMVSQLSVRNSIKIPQSWYESYGQSVPGLRALDSQLASDRVETESSLLQFCWNVPWEQERLHRAIGMKNAPATVPGPLDRLSATIRKISYRSPRKPTETNEYLAGLPGLNLIDLQRFGSFDLASRNAALLARLRGLMIVVALRLYEAEKRRLPESLAELVPDYLAAVPVDPLHPERKPFRYELSQGRVVYLIDRDSLGPAPGMDTNPSWSSVEFLAVAAAAGTVTAFPLLDYPGPVIQPGSIGIRSLNADEASAVLSVAGGLVFGPFGLGMPSDGPGTPPDPGQDPENAPKQTLGWVSQPANESNPAAKSVAVGGMGSPPSASPTDRLIPTDVPAGRGIVWSVGQDGKDDGGIWLANRGTYRGDLIFLVPPAVKLQPIPGERK